MCRDLGSTHTSKPLACPCLTCVRVGHAGDTPVSVSSMRWEENICLFKKISSDFKYCLQILIVIYLEYLK